MRIFPAEREPGEPGEETLEDGDGQIGPGKLGEGGGEGEADNHYGEADAKDNRIVGYDADGIDGVTVEHIGGLWQDGKDHDARQIGGNQVTLCKEECGEETDEEVENQRDKCRGSHI